MNTTTISAQPVQRSHIVVSPTKSVGVAVLLAILFGPIGMLYSTIVGALIMLPISLLVGFVTLGFGLILILPICAVWSGLAAEGYNSRLLKTMK